MQTQASTTLTRGGCAFRLGVALLLALLPLVPASARVQRPVHHNDAWARQQFARAERMREALNGRPLGERTRREYQRVIDSYRRVYFGSPASSKADPSVVATAELMVEMGRRFDDDKILRGAIDQYRFLRREYPGSKYRFDALFTIGEIYKDDLNDPAEARTTFTDFVHRYPRNRLADDARAAVKEIDAAAVEMARSARKTARKQRASNANVGSGANDSGGSASAGSSSDEASEASNAANAVTTRRSGLPRVTGVRHWSTPDYTRVAIDVEQEVKFGSQRISNPDRIFFDLRDTKLASTLVGKTFDVDDGFLKKIRVAEFQPGRTRIVLEVDNLSSYDAFLLPDPYRLIIDIHGKDVHGKDIHGKDVHWKQKRTTTAKADADVTASLESNDDSDDVESRASPPGWTGETPVSPQAKADAAGSRKPGLVETDLLPEDGSADSKPHNPARPVSGSGVTKTTVAVKDSNHGGAIRRIPKTIVEADDNPNDSPNDIPKNSPNNGVPATVASLEHEKLRPGAAAGEPSNASDADAITTPKSESHSSSSSSSSPSVRRKRSRSSASAAAPDTADLHSDTSLESREARPTASGDRSLTRALGLKIGKIVIDAGHGGHDTGTIGPNGLCEKDVVLDVAKRLGRLLESRLGAEVIYTRRDDTFIPLETRTAIANRERADLFISIHANSSRDSDARGVETYYLNFTSSPEALEVAARENAVSEKSIHELQDLVKKIALKDKIDESREFAGDVQESLYGGLALENAGIRNRGIKKAPFIVLIGANMPSILAEISFVSNPTDERRLETSEHRQRIAESLYRGVSKYVNGLSGVKVASKIEKEEGQ
ncbi:MAG: N-acetylmuramoyl-L-alanine amidase [Terriglobales bacterium]|jgi:N-acetylmuramoyl-L-alanine amidase